MLETAPSMGFRPRKDDQVRSLSCPETISANLYFSFSVAWTRRTPNRNGRSQCKCCSTITANCSHSGAIMCSSICEIAFLKSVKVQTSDEINSAKQVKWEECHCEQLEYLSFFLLSMFRKPNRVPSARENDSRTIIMDSRKSTALRSSNLQPSSLINQVNNLQPYKVQFLTSVGFG